MFLPRQKNQNYLIPVDIREMLPENKLRDAVDEIVEEFFEFHGTEAIFRGNSDVGNLAIPPQVTTKAMLFAYMNGVYSSRQIEKRTRVDIEYIYLAEKYVLNYRTVARFRSENAELFKKVFLYFIAVLKQLKMLNHLALFTDSTKIKANASDDSYMTKDELQLYRELIEEAMKKHEITDIEEEELNKKIEESVDGRSVKKMKKRIKEIVRDIAEGNTAEVEEKKNEIDEKVKKVERENLKGINLTDGDATFMKNGAAITHSYNIEMTVEENGFIVGIDVVNKSDDYGEGVKQLEQVKENLQIESLCGVMHAADGGFGSVDLLEYYEENGINGLVPQRMIGWGRYPLSSYAYDEEKDTFIAPDGVTIYRKKSVCKLENGIIQHIYLPDAWKKGLRKNIVVEDTFFLRERMRKKLELNRERYKKRAATIEPVCGDIKHNRKFRMVSMRGIRKVRIEAHLLAIAHNMKKFFSFRTERVV
jgi:transposase